MKLSAVLLARVLAFVETFDLVPRGHIFYPDLIRAAVERYQFQKYPKSVEEFDEQKGVEFYEGKAGNTAIERFTIFNSLLVLETRAGTDTSKRILEEMLTWGKQELGLNYEPGMVRRFAYVSNVSFYSDAPLLAAHPGMAKLAADTGKAVSEIWGEPVTYDGLLFAVGHDPLARKNPIAAFTIQRRAEASFSENKYFSEAPLPTDLHVAFLEQFEREVEVMGRQPKTALTK